MDRYQNDHEQWCATVEDDTSRRVFDITETDASSVSQAVEPLDSVDEEFDSLVPILEVITDYGSEFVNLRRDDWPDRDREFEHYFHENDINPTLCKVGQLQSNGKIGGFFQTYEKHRQRFGTLDRFLPSATGNGTHEPQLGETGDASRAFRAIDAIASNGR